MPQRTKICSCQFYSFFTEATSDPGLIQNGNTYFEEKTLISIYLPSFSCRMANKDFVLVKFRIVAIETPGGKRNLNMNINAQQAILKAYISKQFKLILNNY